MRFHSRLVKVGIRITFKITFIDSSLPFALVIVPIPKSIDADIDIVFDTGKMWDTPPKIFVFC